MTGDDINNLKRKLRKLKQLEKTIRSQSGVEDNIPLVWDKFFDTRDNPKNIALYPIEKLLSMSKSEYKTIVEDYFARVYYEIYAYKGFTDEVVYDTELLAQLDLPPIADKISVKKRFRELAKLYHPDTGGNAAKFIELMQSYERLTK